MMKLQRIILVIGLITSAFLFNSCSNPYIGRKVAYSPYSNCYCFSFPKSCTIEDNCFIFDFEIRRGNTETEYILNGTCDGGKGDIKSWAHLNPRDCRFVLMLIKGDTIVDNVSFYPKGTDHTHKMPFNKTFKTDQDFDSVRIYWKVSVRG